MVLNLSALTLYLRRWRELRRHDLQMLPGSGCKYIYFHQVAPVLSSITGIILVSENCKEFLLSTLIAQILALSLSSWWKYFAVILFLTSRLFLFMSHTQALGEISGNSCTAAGISCLSSWGLALNKPYLMSQLWTTLAPWSSHFRPSTT